MFFALKLSEFSPKYWLNVCCILVTFCNVRFRVDVSRGFILQAATLETNLSKSPISLKISNN